ncbi:MAG: hypothetical protein JRN42_05850 [Nitrososphaerota archaeon]|nr:hypothetical protein [Nitrososphaerota archaeon]
MPVNPSGTNSTMFTDCCGAAITNDELHCPVCGNKVVGSECDSDHERGRKRWQYATRHWDRPRVRREFG